MQASYPRPFVWKNTIKMKRNFLRSFLLPSLLLPFASCASIAIVIEDEVEPDGETIAPTRDKSESHRRVIVSQIIFKFIYSGETRRFRALAGRTELILWAAFGIKKCTGNFRWQNIRFFVSLVLPYFHLFAFHNRNNLFLLYALLARAVRRGGGESRAYGLGKLLSLYSALRFRFVKIF